MKVKYVGPAERVYVPEADTVCEQGKEIEVEDSLGERMVLQPQWETKPRKRAESTEAEPKDPEQSNDEETP